jgi:hypothetical protein
LKKWMGLKQERYFGLPMYFLMNPNLNHAHRRTENSEIKKKEQQKAITKPNLPPVQTDGYRIL